MGRKPASPGGCCPSSRAVIYMLPRCFLFYTLPTTTTLLHPSTTLYHSNSSFQPPHPSTLYSQCLASRLVTLSPLTSSSRAFLPLPSPGPEEPPPTDPVTATSPGPRITLRSPLVVSPSTTRPLRSGPTRRSSSSPSPVPSPPSALPTTSPNTLPSSPRSARRVSTLLPSWPTTMPTS